MTIIMRKMKKMKTQVARKRENLAVGLIVLSVFSLMITSVQVSYSQQQVASDGGLTVTLNGDTFRMGDEIVVSGTVEERDPDSNAVIYVTDPLSERVESGFPRITADNTFTYSFEADMEEIGNYLVLVRYWLPGDTLESEEVELIFEYVGDEEIEEEVEVGEAIESSAVINMTAINQSIVQAMEYTEQANIAMQNNDTQAVFGNLNLISKELESIQGNLTLTAAESSGGINIDSNTSSETRTPSPPTPPQQEQQPSPQSEQPVL